MAVKHSFQTLFAVPLSCDGCVKSVSDSLYKLDGINKVEGNLKDQLISVEGSVAPSAIVEAIQATGRDAILRGSGASNSAAVSILETYADQQEHRADDTNREVRGLARMVQVSPERTLIDLTIRGVAPGTYRATIREYGDLKDGAESTGPVWSGGGEKAPKGSLGVVQVSKDGRGSAFVDHAFQIWEVIGHAMVLTKQDESLPLKNDDSTVVGVIARSAGMWDNDKTVCSCTGKTLWEEREDEVKKGML
ncbi:superoxide dismutase [Trichoderma ceciliae]